MAVNWTKLVIFGVVKGKFHVKESGIENQESGLKGNV
jgi:hypothetical protein